MNSPSLFIDIEGYSALFEQPGKDSRYGVDALMLGIYKAFKDNGKSDLKGIFAYHIGDDFSINASYDYHEITENLVCLGVSLMRYILWETGHFAKCGMAKGIMKDIKSCYPKPIRDFDGTNFKCVGENFMSIMSVMGTALINSNKTQSKGRGSVFCLTDEIFDDFDDSSKKWIKKCSSREGHELYHLDWVGFSNERIESYMEIFGLGDYSAEEAISKMKECMTRNGCKPDWEASTRSALNLETNKSW